MRLALVALLALSTTGWAAPPHRIAVITPQAVAAGWQAATPRERRLLLHLVAAAQALRPVVFFQTHRHALAVRRFLQTAFRPDRLATTRRQLTPGELADLTEYAAAFLVRKGPYDDFSNRKMTLAVLGPEKLAALWRQTLGAKQPALDEIVRLMTDPAFEAMEYPEAPDGSQLGAAGGNLYERGLVPAELGSIAPSANCRVVRGPRCQRLAASEATLDPEVRRGLRLGAHHLGQAARFASSDAQRRQLEALAAYLLGGDPADAAAASRALVADAPDTRFRIYVEFLYVMYDFRGQMGKLEVTVQATDRELTRLTGELARSAGYFEEKFPYGPFRAQFPADYAPGILMVGPVARGGPGSEDPGLHVEAEIDGKPRSLNIVPTGSPEVTAHPIYRADLEARLRAFSVAADAEVALAHHDPAVTRLVLLHELVGHGSGRVDPERYRGVDPYTAMGPEGSSLEEMRANLAAIAISLDPRLVEIGLARDRAQLEALLGAWITQYVAMTAGFAARGTPLVWPHLRAALFLIDYWLEKRALALEDGRFRIVDLAALVRSSTELLEVVQRVRATRDEATLAQLYGRYAPIDSSKVPWVRAMAGRADALGEPVLVVWRPYRIGPRGVAFLGQPDRLETIIPEL